MCGGFSAGLAGAAVALCSRMMNRHIFVATSLLALVPVLAVGCLAPDEQERDDDQELGEDQSAIAADAECADRAITVTTSGTACVGEVRCLCIDNFGRSRITGPLAPGDQCPAAPGEACSSFSVDAAMMCDVALATTPDPVCPPGCTPNGAVGSKTSADPQCCKATKSLECCCPDAADEADIAE